MKAMSSNASMRAAMFALLVLPCFNLLFSEQKERTQKPAAQKATPTAPLQTSPGPKDDKNEDDPLFRGMKYRSIGPFRGGRSLTAAGIPGDPTTYYFGSTGGGGWEATDGGTTWAPGVAKEGCCAIGSLAVAPSDPNIVYV